MVFVGGVIQDPTTHYTITGSSITFTSNIPTGTQAVVINPSVASVPSLQAASVTFDKLAADIHTYIQKTAVSASTSGAVVDSFDGTNIPQQSTHPVDDGNGEYETREALVIHDGPRIHPEYAVVYTGRP